MKLLCVVLFVILLLLNTSPVKAQMNPDDNLLVICKFSRMWGWGDALEIAELELNRVLPAVIINDFEATNEQSCDLYLMLRLSPVVCEWSARMAIGCFDPGTRIIYLADEPPDKITILLHELAHALGIMFHPCNDGVKSILSCEYDPDQLSFTEWDMEYFATLGYPIVEKNFRD